MKIRFRLLCNRVIIMYVNNISWEFFYPLLNWFVQSWFVLWAIQQITQELQLILFNDSKLRISSSNYIKNIVVKTKWYYFILVGLLYICSMTWSNKLWSKPFQHIYPWIHCPSLSISPSWCGNIELFHALSSPNSFRQLQKPRSKENHKNLTLSVLPLYKH